MFIPKRIVEEKLKQILADDIGLGDVTTSAVIPANLIVNAEVVAKEAGIVAGIDEVTLLAECLGLTVKAKVIDGEQNKEQTSSDACFRRCPNNPYSRTDLA